MAEFKMGPLQKRWIKRLKAHPERQIIGQLGKGNKKEYKACCLGEAGLMLGTCEFDDEGILRDNDTGEKEVLLSYKDIGLRSSNGQCLSGDDEPMVLLTHLNDDGDHTWTDIAYIIEAAPELFFTEPK